MAHPCPSCACLSPQVRGENQDPKKQKGFFGFLHFFFLKTKNSLCFQQTFPMLILASLSVDESGFERGTSQGLYVQPAWIKKK
jgi:hypothetical protein